MVEFAVATLVTLPSAGEFNLHVAANQRLETKSSDLAKGQVMMHRLLHETSDKDLDIISKSIVFAYNSVCSATDYSFTASETKALATLETKTPVSVPDKVGFTPSFWSGCRWYPNDDALTDSNTMTGHTTSPFEVVTDVKMTNDDDSTWMLTDKTTAFARFTQSFLPGCRFAIALDDYPISKDTHIALKHQGFQSSRTLASPTLPTSTTAPSAASTAPTEALRRPRSRVHGGWGIRNIHCAHGR
jgi:hypothetical protein